MTEFPISESLVIDWSDIFKISASSSLLTSGLSWGLTHVFVHKASLQRDARYLAQRLAICLEKFALDCATAIVDNELYSSSEGNAGTRRLSLPKLGDFSSDADWKALDLSLVDRVMSMPNRLIVADNAISFWRDVVADEDCMQTETDRKAGTCGLESWLIAVDLRKRHGIPESDLPSIAWDFLVPLTKQHEADEVQRRQNRKTNHTVDRSCTELIEQTS